MPAIDSPDVLLEVPRAVQVLALGLRKWFVAQIRLFVVLGVPERRNPI
jgi:hypothetical protein